MSDNSSPIVVKTPIKICVATTFLFVLPVAVWLAQILIHRADDIGADRADACRHVFSRLAP